MQAVNPDMIQQTGGFFLKTSMDWVVLITAGMRFHRRDSALKKDLSPITRGACFHVYDFYCVLEFCCILM